MTSVLCVFCVFGQRFWRYLWCFEFFDLILGSKFFAFGRYYICVMAKKSVKCGSVNIRNRRASFDFALFDSYTAGIVLTGTEIKSIRQGKASLVDTFCYVSNGEVWVKNMYVAHYEQGSYNNHVERRDRKLLLNRREIRKIMGVCKQPGFSIVPTLLFINEDGRAKLDIALARGKKEYDKRASEKERELKDVARKAMYR